MLRDLADKYKSKIMFMYVDKDQKRLIQKASGKEEPLDEVLPAFRMFVANKDGSLGRILKSAPADKDRQVVVAGREMTHPKFAPQFINKFVDESYAQLTGKGGHEEL